MDPSHYTTGEILGTLLGLAVTGAFGAWAAVVKKAAEDMGKKFDMAIEELSMLREEIHRDRVTNEKRFVRLEVRAGLGRED